jgi:hypothetical protein
MAVSIFLISASTDTAGSDVCIYFRGKKPAYADGAKIGFEMELVCRYDQPSGGKFVENSLSVDVLGFGDGSKLVADFACLCGLQLSRHCYTSC